MGKPLKHTCDTQEQIDACLNCKRPECVRGCIPLKKDPGSQKRKPNQGSRGRISKLDKDDTGKKLFSQGLNDREVAEIVGLTTNSVYSWRKQNGIVATRFRKKGGKI